MAKEKNMTGIPNDENDDDVGPWSDLTHGVLFLVMMQLGVIDFVAFSGVCKSWRSFASSYMNTFMASRAPMFLYAEDEKDDDGECCCHLEDFEGRRFKTVLPHSAGGICVGITCGYLVICVPKTHDFWLVNLITRHELHFPNAPSVVISYAEDRGLEAILVFSPSMSGGWVFVVLSDDIWFSMVGGEGAWNHVPTPFSMENLHFFKGKIYTVEASDCNRETKPIGVLKLDQKESKLMLLKTKYFSSFARADFVCSGEDLYLLTGPTSYLDRPRYKAVKLDFGEMKWENTTQEDAFFVCNLSQGAVIKPESWWQGQFRISTSDNKLFDNERDFEPDDMWYFPHMCRNINLMDE